MQAAPVDLHREPRAPWRRHERSIFGNAFLAHVVVASSTTRENFYVAMTRGREANTAYLAVDRPDVAHVGPRPNDTDSTARSVLYGVLQHVGAELSAHETIAVEQDAWESIAQLAAEYETIAATAQRERWASMLRETGLTQTQANDAIHSEAFGALTAELRRAEAHHMNVRCLLLRIVAARGFDDAEDVAAVLHSRIVSAIARNAGAGRSGREPAMVVGLIPAAVGPIKADMRRALDERSDLMKARASAVLDAALLAKAPWTRVLGSTPHGATAATWRQCASTVAAYRDRYGIVGARVLGPPPGSMAQELDAARARAAIRAARYLAEDDYPFDVSQIAVQSVPRSSGIRF